MDVCQWASALDGDHVAVGFLTCHDAGKSADRCDYQRRKQPSHAAVQSFITVLLRGRSLVPFSPWLRQHVEAEGRWVTSPRLAKPVTTSPTSEPSRY